MVSKPEDIYASEFEDDDYEGFHIQPFGLLTTYEEVRAVFGLSSAEIPDDMLSQRTYTRGIVTALNSVDATLMVEWSQHLTAIPALQALVEDFALYCVADKLCDVLPLIAAKSLTDSKATFQRFDVDLQSVSKTIRQRYELAKDALAAALVVDKTKTIPLPALFAVSSPSTDRVTG